MSAFFIACNIVLVGVVAAECEVGGYDQSARILRVIDGDTVVLSNKKKVRLLGINAPELSHKLKKEQPYAKAAKYYLKRQLGLDKIIHLKFGKQKKDHYGRLLAHLFLKDGRNLNAMLVKAGFASAVAVPPNIALIDCYFKLEQQAKEKGKNIWSSGDFNYKWAKDLNVKDSGFSFVKGKVIRVGKSRDSIWLQLADQFTLRIKRKDFKYFKNVKLANLNLKKLEKHTLYTRGWIYKWKDELYMQIRHPKMIYGF